MLNQDPADFEGALGALLVEVGKLDVRGLDRARRIGRDGRDGLVDLLPKLGLIGERDLAEAIAQLLDLPIVSASDYPGLPLFEDRISAKFLQDARILPLAEDTDGVSVAMANPLDRTAIDAMRVIAGREILPRVAIPAELEAAIERLYGRNRGGIAAADEAEDADGDAMELDVERLKDLASEAPVIRLVNKLIARAAEQRASDVHIEPFEDYIRVRYRVDGVLREVDPIPRAHRHAVISRIKIMARLNIAERRLPQDGRIKLVARGRPIDLRVATMPGLHGETLVVRLLDRESVALDFKVLGIDGDALQRYLRILERPHGIVLVTGPTGSGKTTTLYASLVRLNRTERKILTVEDPIEYQLKGINQVQVKPSIGLDFANILRGFLRHDPDILMVGEVRDLETAEIAVHAALTGHLVLSTLHTNNAAASITRLLDMGVRDYLITSTVNGIAAQRLVRKLCSHCRKAEEPLPELVRQLGLARYANGRPIKLFSPAGCESCHGTGFYGRLSLFETLIMTDALRQLVLSHREAGELQRAAVEEGMQTMYDDGMRKALAGVTTVEEVLQVTGNV